MFHKSEFQTVHQYMDQISGVMAYSVHVDNGIHFVFNDELIARQYRQPRNDASVDSDEKSLFSVDEDLLFSDADV